MSPGHWWTNKAYIAYKESFEGSRQHLRQLVFDEVCSMTAFNRKRFQFKSS